jgi:hypothetical protein
MVFETLSSGEKIMAKATQVAPSSASEFQQFSSLATALIRVPKSEVDALLMKERKKKARTKNGPASHKQVKK